MLFRSITIVGTRDILPTDSVDLFPGRARMIIHKPIDTVGYTDDNLDELVDRARSVIESGLRETAAG